MALPKRPIVFGAPKPQLGPKLRPFHFILNPFPTSLIGANLTNTSTSASSSSFPSYFRSAGRRTELIKSTVTSSSHLQKLVSSPLRQAPRQPRPFPTLLRPASTPSFSFARHTIATPRTCKSTWHRPGYASGSTSSSSGPFPSGPNAKAYSFDFDTRARSACWSKYHNRFQSHRSRFRRRRRGLREKDSATSLVRSRAGLFRFKIGAVYFATTTGPQRAPRPCKISNSTRTRIQPSPLSFSAGTQHFVASPSRHFLACRPVTSLLAGRGSSWAPKLAAHFQPIRGIITSCTIKERNSLQARESSLPLFVPLAALLKSSAALNAVNLISRIALTVLPFSVRAKYFGSKISATPAPGGGISQPSTFSRWSNTSSSSDSALGSSIRYLFPILVTFPFILLGGIVIASLEQTPITGRWRTVMLSPTEESEMVASVLAAGENHASKERDWVQILRCALEIKDEGVSSTTGRRMLFGGEVLDHRDWRVRWTEAVLRALEKGVPALGREQVEQVVGSDGPVPQPPPTRYPLKPRPAIEDTSGWTGKTILGKHAVEQAIAESDSIDLSSLNVSYELIVIDRAEANAFSFGFGPGMSKTEGRQGVIVVYTGFIDQILGSDGPSSKELPPKPESAAARSSFLSFFTSKSGKSESIPNLVPTTLPSQEQTKAMAVLLSHELSHLLLSHSIEHIASYSLLLKHLSRLASDVIRTITFPIVAMLGPFLSDAINSSLKVGASSSPLCTQFGTAMLACQSRGLETEADLVALRLLATSGIDPRHALDFWEKRLEKHRSSERKGEKTSATYAAEKDGTTGCTLTLSSHPVEAERVEVIRKELEKWKNYREEQDALKPA